MRKNLASAFVVVLVLPLITASLVAEAAPATPKVVKPILRIANGLEGSTIVTPAHLPVPGSTTKIGPGAHLLMAKDGGDEPQYGCTANFVWTKTTTTTGGKGKGKNAGTGKGKSKSKKGGTQTTTTTRYLGAAGHCFLPVNDDLTPQDEGKTSTHGPDADYDPSQTTVWVCVAECEFGGELGFEFTGTLLKLGPVAYARQTKDGDDIGNDFGIVEIPASVSEEMIEPSMPVWGGPSTVEDVSPGARLCLYGNGAGTGEVFPTKARAGVGTGVDPKGQSWSSVMPSTPGDSGSAVVTCGPAGDGVHGIGAAGILTHIVVGISPEAGIDGTTTGRAAQMVKEDTGTDLRLVLEGGTQVAPTQPPTEPQGPPITPNEPVHDVVVGGEYTWNAGPFNSLDGGELGGEPCSGREPATEHCDYEFVQLNVPAGGAELTVSVSPDLPNADFDLFVYGPDGALVGESGNPAVLDEQVFATVEKPGTYTIGVNPWAAVEAGYTGVVNLDPVPQPQIDGTISPGESYTWSGDPPLDVNPVFTCADPLVSLFCDNELIQVNVPAGGGTLVLDVNADFEGDDFDVCTYTPSGTQACFNEDGNEHIEQPVTRAGVYRIGVSAFLAPLGTYTATASLQ